MLDIIRDTVRKIPRGKVATYGEVAKAAGFLDAHLVSLSARFGPAISTAACAYAVAVLAAEEA